VAENKNDLVVLQGVVEDIVFKNPSNGYIIFTLDADGAPETVTGNLGDVVEGETLKLRGSYVSNAKYGRQFKAVTCERTLPTTESEMRRYIGSGIIKGVGPSLAKKIVAAFGTDSLDIIENDPKRLAELNGITVDKALYISNEFRKLCGIRSIIEFLQKYDISPVTAAIVWKIYEEESVFTVKCNPYILCDPEIGVDFTIADRIAYDLELDMYSCERIKAGIAYVLRENSFAGHTCLPLDRFEEISCKFLNINHQQFADVLEEQLKEENLFKYYK